MKYSSAERSETLDMATTNRDSTSTPIFLEDFFFFLVLTPTHFGSDIARHLALDIVVKRHDFVVLFVQFMICQPRELEAVKTKVALETLLRTLDPLCLLYCLLVFLRLDKH